MNACSPSSHWNPNRSTHGCNWYRFTRFHDDAWIFSNDDEGHLRKGLIALVFGEWAAPPDLHISGRIISVTQAGDIANVPPGFEDPDDPDDGWVDSRNLSRIGGTWKDMNKTATHSTVVGCDRVNKPEESWLDLINLLKIDGVWKITNVTATQSSRTAGG